jgi:pimeloyl-ACP methyl ester carboxylesterase
LVASKRDALLPVHCSSIFSYWDVKLKPEEYSYVRAAVKAGYSTLTYDRLGVGKSDKPDGYDVAQIPVHAEVIAQLTVLARSGKIASAAQPHLQTVSIPAFTKVVHVGHSIGSVMTSVMLSTHPDLSDGAILTAFILGNKPGGAPQISQGWKYAAEVHPRRFRDRGVGYMVMSDEHPVDVTFFSRSGGNFDPAALQYALDTAETTTAGELLSVGVVSPLPAPKYKGPLQVSLAAVRWCEEGWLMRRNSSSSLQTTWASATAIATAHIILQ